MSNLKAILKEQVLDLKKILNNVNKFSKYPKLLQSMLKKISVIWSQDDDSRRVFALLILMKSIKKNPDYFSICSKGMYLVYVKNSRFIYGCNIGKNNFMRNGLLEIYSLQLDEAYKHAFVFIRQLAITVRKAYLRENKEDSQAVYNWQFICSLRFWSEFVARNSMQHDLIRTLIHPLVQIILGTVRLNPGTRWIPLRFHCVEFLHILAGINNLQIRVTSVVDGATSPALPAGTSCVRTLVPSLPLLLDVFRIVDFNKRSSTASKAPMDLRLLLHFSPSQCQETAFLDSICVWLHDLLTDSLALYSFSVAFPEYSSSAVTEIRAFIKTCNVANFSRDFKILLNKVKLHSEFVKKKRSVVKSLLDVNALTNVEEELYHSDSPLMEYYLLHRKQRIVELTRLADRFKNEGQVQEHQSYEDMVENDASETKSKKKKQENSTNFDEDSESDTNSDASYDYDDGKSVTHVSRSDASNKSKKITIFTQIASDADSDVDLKQALEADDEEDILSTHTDDNDELTDFNLDDTDSDTKNHIRRKRKLRDPDIEGEGLDLDSFSSGDDGSDLNVKVSSIGDKVSKKSFGFSQKGKRLNKMHKRGENVKVLKKWRKNRH